MTCRHYREEDYEALCGFLIELNRADRAHINWNWARFEWMYEHPEFDRDARGAIGLWSDAGRIVGAAIYDMYFGEAFCGVLPAYEALYPEILSYAYREMKDGDGLAIAIPDDRPREIEAARNAGFAPIEQEETVLKRTLGAPVPVALPEGLRIAELDPGEDLEAFQWLLWQGFDHGDDREACLAQDVSALRRRVHFDPRLSLTAVDRTGEKVAYCCLWYHADTDYAYVEPVCTVPAYRGKGIAGALVSEAMNRAAAYGAKAAYVISDLPFYKKLGFSYEQHYTFCRKP